jgi:hypothetical protein
VPSQHEIDARTEAVRKAVPAGMPFADASRGAGALGFSCSQLQMKLIDPQGKEHLPEPHLECNVEERWLLLCTERTRALILQRKAAVSNVLVSFVRFC